jgi:uncharacterized protein
MQSLRGNLRIAIEELHRGAHKLYGERLHGLVLFGSHARGDAGPESDVDIAIILEGQWRRSEEMERCAPLCSGIQQSTGLRVDLGFLRPTEWSGEPNDAEPDIFATIRSEGRLLTLT